MRHLTIGLVLLLLTGHVSLSAESPVGLWLSEERTEAGIGKTLEFSSDGRIRLSQGMVIGQQWVLQKRKKKGYIVQIIDPATREKIRSVQLEVNEKVQELIETDLVTGERFKMAFVSKGHQDQGPPFLGRWQFMLPKFGLLAVYEYTEDGWVWLRAPIQADLGTYRMEGNTIIPQWPGDYPPLIEIISDGRTLVATTPEGRRERFLPPKALEMLTSRSSDPR